MAEISLTFNGQKKYLRATSISYGWQNLMTDKPAENSYSATEVQFTGWENPVFSIDFNIAADQVSSSSLDWSDWNAIVRNKPTSTSQVILNIVTGEDTQEKTFSSYGASASGKTDIPVVVKSYDVKFGTTDSKLGYFWKISAKLRETSQ